MNILYILLAVLFFGFLIFIHELGHFIVARLCGVKVLEFAIGMGPKLISVKSKKSGVRYSLRLFPIGGYVNMLGENGMETVQGSAENEDGRENEEGKNDRDFFVTLASETEEKEGDSSQSEELPSETVSDPRAYCNQSVWKRMLISLAGPLMNILLGFVLMLVFVIATRDGLGTTIVHSFPEEGATSVNAGLLPGDEIVKIGKVRVHTLYELNYEISEQGYRPVSVVVNREGQRVTLENVSFPVTTEGGTDFGMRDFYVQRVTEVNLGTLLKHTFWRSWSCVKMVYDSIAGLFVKRYSVESVSGPVGITGVITQAAKTNWLSVLHLLILISINLGVMNLLPLPALDGGHLLIYVVELIRGKPLKPEVEGIINFIGLVLLLGLAVVITIKDVIAL